MHYLVTAGGTSERIDGVQSITNFATGRLGSLIAENSPGNPVRKPERKLGKFSMFAGNMLRVLTPEPAVCGRIPLR